MKVENNQYDIQHFKENLSDIYALSIFYRYRDLSMLLYGVEKYQYPITMVYDDEFFTA